MVDLDQSLRWITERPCRLCGEFDLESLFRLGDQVVGSYFPGTRGEDIHTIPLTLMRCRACSLVQLSDSPDHADIYATGHYGYRSGQNPVMVNHLAAKAANLTKVAELAPGDVVIDIASNDGTLLACFDAASDGLVLVGIDPTTPQFEEHLPAGVTFIPELFSAEQFAALGTNKAKLITSCSMLYDLEDPVAFAREIEASLADDGLWHFEQCYLPTMLEANSFDTICHEHLTYYTVETASLLLSKVGMRIIDVELNDANGGSFAVTACKLGQYENQGIVVDMPETTTEDIERFASRSKRLRDELVNLVRTLNFAGLRVGGLGASTKGNTTLQFCGFGPADIVGIGEINADKIGRFTPGTEIPIVAEDEIADQCDFLIVLPWHFREGITPRMDAFLKRGGRLIYPLPTLEVVGS